MSDQIKNEKLKKLPMALLPLEWKIGLIHLLGKGARKYAPRDWEEKPQLYMNRIDSLERHLADWLRGQDYDFETEAHNLVAVAFNALMVYSWQTRGHGADNRPNLAKEEVERLIEDFAGAYEEEPTSVATPQIPPIKECKIGPFGSLEIMEEVWNCFVQNGVPTVRVGFSYSPHERGGLMYVGEQGEVLVGPISDGPANVTAEDFLKRYGRD